MTSRERRRPEGHSGRLRSRFAVDGESNLMANVRDFGARGDGQSDDTPAIQHALERGDGILSFPPGDYVLTRPLQIALEQRGRIAIEGSGATARLVMTGAGPALHLIGTHPRNAEPS